MLLSILKLVYIVLFTSSKEQPWTKTEYVHNLESILVGVLKLCGFSIFFFLFMWLCGYCCGFKTYVSDTLFSNSLVRARPALSRKILSLWMARAKIARAWPALFWCCFYQHQSSARPAPGADQRVSERSSTKFRPKFRLHGQMPHNSRAARPSRLFF